MTAGPQIHRLFHALTIFLLAVSIGVVAAPSSHAAMNAQAAAVGDAALSTCNGTGKELRDCVAGALDRMAENAPQGSETQRALRTAAAGVRAAVSKAQAISAIAKCQSLIAGALKRVRAMGGGDVLLEGWGREGGLGPVVRVLARAAALIQSKG